jgi:DNA primase
MDNQIEEIKRRIDIVEFIGSFITLKKAGRNFKALCPFHQEKTPSFVVSPERQIWHCFGSCGEGGDIIKFLMKWENITFYEALRELAKKAGVRLEKTSFEDNLWKKKQKLMEINNLTTQYFQYILEKTKFGKKGIDYLVKRKIRPEMIKKFQLGYAPLSWRSLFTFLQKKKYLAEDLVQAGLIIKGGKDYYDRFRGRLMFPIKNPRGEVIGFSGRMIEGDEKEAKYINSPETFLYHKRETLYGIDLAKEAIKKEGSVLLVEGEFDMISPYQQGIENIVAIKGSAVTREQLLLLKRYVNKINLFLDADSAGEEAIKRSVEEIENLELEANVIKIDFAKDPDEAVNKDLVSFKKAIKSPILLYDFLLDLLKSKYSLKDPFGKRKIGDEMVAYIEKIKNPIVQSFYIKKLADLLEVSEAVVNTLIRKIRYKEKQKQFYRREKTESKEENRELVLQKYLLSFVFQQEKPYRLVNSLIKIISSNDFSLPVFQKIWEKLLDFQKKYPEFNLNLFVEELTAEIKPVFDEIYLYASHEPLVETENLDRVAWELKKISLKRKISEILALKEEIDESKKEKIRDLNQQLNQVEKMLAVI